MQHSKRLFTFCPSFNGYNIEELTDCCEYCRRFFAKCCRHSDCHSRSFVFVDGACAGNGKPGARAGIACVIGNDPDDQCFMAVTDAIDPAALRTSQRAELLAALHGLHLLVGAEQKVHDSDLQSGEEEDGRRYIVVADSEYVVKGMTEWMPQWKKNHWKNKQGRVPANLDLFQRLEAAVADYEGMGLTIQFLHIRREFNGIADALAKKAAGLSIAL
ncbi:ribonuclease H-like domain-containing protein [Mycena vulgaris]|nr:ribonuclease H-like domain-containing protein [Mycena vulgaris]